MPATLPSTSASHYLTGTAALSIPDETGEAADWHFDEAFLREGTRFRVAGVNFPVTSHLLGDEGIRECSAIMRKRAVPLPPGQPFYAANFARSVLDVLLATTEKHQRADFLNAAELLSPDDFGEVVDKLNHVRSRITDTLQLNLIDQWIAAQTQNANT